ncbi:MAG: response regulator transcription factor [Nitratireductor sp.]
MGNSDNLSQEGYSSGSSAFEVLLSKLSIASDLNEIEWQLDEISQELGLETGCLLERNRLSTLPIKAPTVFGTKFLPVKAQSESNEQATFNLDLCSEYLADRSAKTSPFLLLNEAENGALSKADFRLGAELSANRFDVLLVPLLPIWCIDYVIVLRGKNSHYSYELMGKINLLTLEMFNALVRFRKKEFDAIAVLSKREREVLAWTSQGKTSFEIAGILELSEHTINNYMANLINKLGATNRNHAVALAIQLDLI